jgi:hypothetical protein
MPAPHNHELALAVRLAAVPLAMSACELLVRRRALGRGGLLDFDILALLDGSIARRRSRAALALAWLMGDRRYVVILAAELLVAAALFVAPLTAPLLLVGLGLHLLMMRRNHLSNDGADDMVVVILGSTLVATLAASQLARTAWAVFLTAQLALAYFVSGVSKAQSRAWWCGEAVPGVVGTRIFGHPRFAEFLRCHSWAGALMTWGTLVVETLFPASLFAPRPIFLCALAAMLAFHIGCAVVMGLNTFVWAFAACYPAALWCWAYLARAMSPVSRTIVVLSWLAVSATLLSLLSARYGKAPASASQRAQPTPTG